MYITLAHDFYDGIMAGFEDDPEIYDFEILGVTEIFDNASIVETSVGTFWCETSESEDGIVFMKVITYV